MRRYLVAALVSAMPAACAIDVVGTYVAGGDAGPADAGTEDASRRDADVVGDAGPDARDATPSDAAPAAPTVGATTVHPDSLKVDRVRAADGPVATDGVFDGLFEVAVVGPAEAIAVLRTNAQGTATGDQIWDTWVGNDDVPAELGTVFSKGSQTYTVGVFENGALVNDDAGRVKIGAGPHTLELAGWNGGTFVAGQSFRVVIQVADGGVVRGPVVTY